ncbi:hypothetical protein DRQ50_14205, partial [bacterium]
MTDQVEQTTDVAETSDAVQTINHAEEEEYVDPQALADLMEALERVFKIGVYYPAGHSMCDQAADRFLKALERTLGKAPSLRFEVGGGKLSLQGVNMDPELRGVESFMDLIGGIGISVVEIDSNVSSNDLHDFVSRLLSYRNKIKGARDFQQVVVEGMPLTIGVEHLEFMTREIEDMEDPEAGSGDASQPTIEALLATLSVHGLNTEEIKRCRKLLESIPRYLDSHIRDTGSLPQVSWGEVEKLLMKAARTDLKVEQPRAGDPGERASSHVNLDALTSIFRSLGNRPESEENSREAIDLLLGHLHRPTPKNEGGEKKAPPKPKPLSELMPVAELLAAIEACARESGTDEPQLMTEGRTEELSILLQMMTRNQKRLVQSRIQKRLRDITRTTLSPAEWEIMVAGARGFLDPDEEERSFGPLLLLTDSVRSSGVQSGLAFLRDISEGCSQAQIDKLWPFMLNEILMEGRRKHSVAFDEICSMVARPDRETMLGRLGRLESLEALARKRCVRDVVTPIPLELCPVFSLLLGTSQGSYLGPRIFDGMKRQPQGWICRAILPLVDQYQSRHRRFLEQLLLEVGTDNPSSALSEAAVRIVAEYLPELGTRERHESWVPDTLRA